MIARDWAEGMGEEMGRDCLTGVSFGADENVLGLERGDGCKTLGMRLTH